MSVESQPIKEQDGRQEMLIEGNILDEDTGRGEKTKSKKIKTCVDKQILDHTESDPRQKDGTQDVPIHLEEEK